MGSETFNSKACFQPREIGIILMTTVTCKGNPFGVQFLPWMKGGSAVLSPTTAYCGMLFWSREHRSSMTMQILFELVRNRIPSVDQLPRWVSPVLTVSFPSPAQPLNLCMICEEKIHYDFPGFEASLISLFSLVGLGSQLLGG